MLFGGTDEPAAFCHLTSIGKIGPSTNPKLSKSICELLQKHLGVAPTRTYI